MISRILISASAGIILFLGSVHLTYTFLTHDFCPTEKQLETAMKQVAPRISGETTMWKVWTWHPRQSQHGFGAVGHLWLPGAVSAESDGLSSTGEFAGDLRMVFDQSNQARFSYAGEGQMADHGAWIFAYQVVEQKDPDWLLLAPGQTLASHIPGSCGSIRRTVPYCVSARWPKTCRQHSP